MVSKSTNYCGATRADPTAVLVLCDVACGAQYELIASQYEAAENSRAVKKDSTLGIGRTCPDEAGAVSLKKMGSAVKVPMGKATPNTYLETNLDRLKECGAGKRSELLYNEFIVYDTKQIRMEYVVVFDVDFDVD